MNERIEKLADQAYKDFLSGCSYTNINPIFSELRDRFAKLIIQECHQVIVVGGVDDLDEVMKHFGVEE